MLTDYNIMSSEEKVSNYQMNYEHPVSITVHMMAAIAPTMCFSMSLHSMADVWSGSVI